MCLYSLKNDEDSGEEESNGENQPEVDDEEVFMHHHN